jgi:hypothetical protein
MTFPESVAPHRLATTQGPQAVIGQTGAWHTEPKWNPTLRMLDRKVSSGLASLRRPYFCYSNQRFSQHFWSFFDTHGLGHAFQR